MPRKQSTAARRARAHTRATDGAKYTEALRNFTTSTDAPPPDPTRVLDSDAAGRRLAAAMRRAGLVEIADDLQYILDFEEPEDAPRPDSPTTMSKS